ncbi:GPI mannosyltransferase 3 [Armadillidium nasatum]|uniref:Mannosyltransferase n=1 Tax=Armadillidium nasatum TaxID=96803 RepID=A0A5N5TKD7_9CRUS|nr:GPI mannosyltransferase 3 [Armadillidium nasatum]
MCQFGILLLSIVLDSLFYGRITVVPWNFLKFNLLSGLSSHYGKHPWHWYFTQGLPVICGVHLIPIVFGLIKYFKKYKKIFFPCLWGIVIHSFLEHKEFRFLLPILPILLAIGADSTHTFVKHSFKEEKSNKKKNLLVIIILVIPNTFIFLYMGLVHQRGPIDVMHELRNSLDVKEISSVLFLTPCHSTPLYRNGFCFDITSTFLDLEIENLFGRVENISYIFASIHRRNCSLTCEPNLNRIENYEDEADVFFKDPLKWIDREYSAHPGQTSNLPTYVIMFDILYETLEPFLMENNYKFRKKIFNSHIYDGNRGQYFHIYKKL